MKTLQSILSVALPILLGIAGTAIGAGALAQTAARPAATLVIPIAGTVGGLPESVALSGQALIRAALATDPVDPPGVVISINLSSLTGVGQSTGQRYIAKSEHNLTRPLATAGLVEVTFPFYPAGPGGIAAARTALASFNLIFDVNGQLQNATAMVSNPSL